MSIDKCQTCGHIHCADDLRTRIAAAFCRWDHPDDKTAWETAAEHVRQDCLGAADAVIRELDIAIPCAATGCRMRQIAKRHAEKSSALEMPK